jgi:Phage tail lysozyme
MHERVTFLLSELASTRKSRFPELGKAGNTEKETVMTSHHHQKHAAGSRAHNVREAYEAALAEGLKPVAAKALVANMLGESLAHPNDEHWDRRHNSQGIVQWDPHRSEAIKKHFGKYPKDMSVAEQTRAAIWEIREKFPKTRQAIEHGTVAADIIHELVYDYENPYDKPKAVNQRVAFLPEVSSVVAETAAA